MTKPNRPKWARGLSATLWNHLKETQDTAHPTLRQLRADVEYQERNGRRCYECSDALRSVQA